MCGIIDELHDMRLMRPQTVDHDILIHIIS